MYKSLEKKLYLEYLNTNSDVKYFLDVLDEVRKANHFEHLDYLRIYNDQSCFITATQTQWLNKFLLHFNEFSNTLFEQKLQDSLQVNSPMYAVWNYQKDDKLLQFNHEHGIDIGFDIYIKNKSYIEVLSISGKLVYNFHDHCMNNLSLLHSILKQVREVYDRIGVDFRCDLLLNVNIPNKAFYITSSGNKVYFTDREFECINYLLRGYTTKSTAQKLNISSRTVEEYIKNIREKLGVNCKLEIIKKLEA